MKRKQEEQEKKMKGLQSQVEPLRRENDQLVAQIEKSCDLGKDVRDSNHTAQPITCDKGNKPIAHNDVDTSVNDPRVCR